MNRRVMLIGAGVLLTAVAVGALFLVNRSKLTQEEWSIWKGDYESAQEDIIDTLEVEDLDAVGERCANTVRQVERARRKVLPAPEERLDALVRDQLDAMENHYKKCANKSGDALLRLFTSTKYKQESEAYLDEMSRLDSRIKARIEAIERELEKEDG